MLIFEILIHSNKHKEVDLWYPRVMLPLGFYASYSFLNESDILYANSENLFI